MFDIITIGGATRDITFFTNQGVLIDNKKNPTQEKLLGFEYGAKIPVREAYFTLGGGACNTAVSFSKLGLKVAPVIRIGDDRNGQAILCDLKKEGIETRFVQIDKKLATGFSFVVATTKGREHVAFLYRGANDELRFKIKDLRFKNGEINRKWLYVSSLSGKNWREILNKLYNISNIQTCWNPGTTQLKAGYREIAKYLKKTDVLILNKDEATELVLSQMSNVRCQMSIKDLLKIIHNYGPSIVIITCGVKGAYVYDGRILHYSPALKKKTVDTTGAGDAFGSSFIAGLILYKNDIRKALKLAILNSGSVVQQIGAQNGLLRKRDLVKVNGLQTKV